MFVVRIVGCLNKLGEVGVVVRNVRCFNELRAVRSVLRK